MDNYSYTTENDPSNEFHDQNQNDHIQPPTSTSSKKKLSKMFSVNRTTVPCKIALFCVTLCQGSVNPFVNAFLRSVGFTASQAGLISGIRTFAQMISNPIFGAIADKSRRHQLIFILLCCSTIAFVVPEPWYSIALQKHPYQLASTSSALQNESHVNNTINNSISDTSEPVSEPDSNSTLYDGYFIGMASIVFMAGFSDGPLLNFVDSQTVHILNTDPSGPTYGQQRVFGSIGYGVATILGGVLTGNAVIKNMSKYTPVFFVYLVGALLLLLTSLILYRKKISVLTEDQNESKGVASLILQSMKNPDLLFFYCSALVMGIGDCVMVSFLFLLLEDIGAPSSIMGLCIGLQNVSELFILPFASKIIDRIGGVYVAVLLGSLANVLRFSVLSFTSNVWLILALSVLHIFCFAIYWTAALEKISSLCSKTVCTTILGFHNAIFFGLGSLLGNVIGGNVYHAFGGRWLYRGAAGVCLLWAMLALPKLIFEKRRLKK